MKVPAFLITLLATVAAHAGPRTSANYSVLTDTTDTGGRRTASAAYTNDGSTSGVAGLSTVAAPAQTAKSGYVGQLYEVSALQLAASPLTINETGTRQLSAWQLLDDASYLAVAANVVSWSVVSGPITGINASGLATAATVYQNTLATAQGSFAGNIGTLNLTVLDTIADNFSTYAADGLGDDWQVQYFGTNNPLAAPSLDPDFDGQTNLFEFLAGIDPTEPASRFLLNPSPVPGQPGQMNIILSPRFTDRTYTVKSSPTLGTGAVWSPLTSFSTQDNGATRTITDLNATGSAKFYRVEITKP